CQNYTVLGAARLMHYRLAFNRESIRWGHGVADIIHEAGSVVWGVLYDVDNACVGGLNRKESLGVGYEQLHVGVELKNGTRYHALTYTVINKLEDEISPSHAYLDTMIRGARQHQLPMNYIATLMEIET